MRKILFISHNVTRTGAPYVLLQFLQWIKNQNKNSIIDCVFLADGDLKDEFKKVCVSTYDYTEFSKKTFFNKIYSFLFRKIKGMDTKKESFLNKISKNKYDVIYANSIATVDFAVKLKSKYTDKPKLFLHIHELQTIIKEYLPNFETYIPHIDYFISVSELVKKNLITNWKVNPINNYLVYEFSDKILENNIISSNNKTSERVFEVGASGQVHWRKGDDLFIQVALLVKKKYPNTKIKFTWVGQISNSQKNIIDADIEKAGLTDTVFFVGEQKQPQIYFKNFDVFLMTSREDPFPLVCIEVGKIGIPIICFDKATGTSEITKNQGGFTVPYLDCEEMAEKLMHYYQNEDLRKSHGDYNKEAFAIFKPEIMAEKLYQCIENSFKKTI